MNLEYDLRTVGADSARKAMGMKVTTGVKVSIEVRFAWKRARDYPALLKTAYEVFGGHTSEVSLKPGSITVAGMVPDDDESHRTRLDELRKLAGGEQESQPHPAAS